MKYFLIFTGGLILIVMRKAYVETGEGFSEGRLEGAIQSLVQQGVWELLAKESVEGYFGQHSGITFVLRVL